MKRKLILLIIVALISLTAVGCKDSSDKVEEVLAQDIDNIADTNSADTLKATAKEEGISEKKLQSIIDELTKIGANKYGITNEEYISRIEANGDTPFDEFKTAADFMGITISEYYEYEKSNVGSLTEDQKQIMNGMENALKEAEGTEIPELGTTDIEQMMGIQGNTSGELRVVTGDARELFSYKVSEVLQDYEDEYSILFEYSSDASSEDLVSYYQELIINTEDYLEIKQPGVPGAMLQGMINETPVYISIEELGNKMAVNTYLDTTSKK
ncbi:MAG: hypothetical protein RBR71_04410 [Gudongella sp.]|nr:hypothetical protein [Gudongella sp.]